MELRNAIYQISLRCSVLGGLDIGMLLGLGLRVDSV